MSETIDEIQARLAPRRLLRDATTNVREAAVGGLRRAVRGAGESAGQVAQRAQVSGAALVDHARSHPTHAWLLLSGTASMVGYLLASRWRRRAPAAPRRSWSPNHTVALGTTAIALGMVVGLARRGAAATVAQDEAMLDDTLDASFPASDPPSTIPNPSRPLRF